MLKEDLFPADEIVQEKKHCEQELSSIEVNHDQI